jgi:hypothetical protein
VITLPLYNDHNGGKDGPIIRYVQQTPPDLGKEQQSLMSGFFLGMIIIAVIGAGIWVLNQFIYVYDYLAAWFR